MPEEKKIEGQDAKKRFTSDEVKEILRRYKKALSDRSTWETNWQEIAEYIIPERANITTSGTPGEKKTSKIVDTTAIDDLELWASGMNGLMTNEALNFFKLMMEEDSLNSIEEVALWLENTTERMHRAIRASNFQMEIHECYLDAGSIGTTSLYINNGKDTDLTFQARHINEICILENSDGYVDTIFRKFKLTARQLKQQFGEEKLTTIIKDSLKKDGDKEDEFTIVHCIYPRSDDKREKNDDGNFKGTQESLPFASIYIVTDGNEAGEVIDEGGYHEFPYAVPRTKKMTGEIYGRSPAWNALPDIKMVNAMRKTYLRRLQKETDPPIQMPDEGYSMPPKLGAGGVNYYSGVGGFRDAKIESINFGGQFQYSDEDIKQTRESIGKKFNRDLWLVPIQPNMTAAEYLDRVRQMLRVVGPSVGRFQPELLKPIVTRVFGILYRAGKLADPPVAVQQSGKINVIFISPISDAQQAYEAETMNRAIMMIAPIVQGDPGVMDNFDTDGIARTYWKDLRAPLSLLKSIDDVEKTRSIREEQMVKDKQAQELMMMTQGAKNLKGTGIVEGLTGQGGAPNATVQ